MKAGICIARPSEAVALHEHRLTDKQAIALSHENADRLARKGDRSRAEYFRSMERMVFIITAAEGMTS